MDIWEIGAHLGPRDVCKAMPLSTKEVTDLKASKITQDPVRNKQKRKITRWADSFIHVLSTVSGWVAIHTSVFYLPLVIG